MPRQVRQRQRVKAVSEETRLWQGWQAGDPRAAERVLTFLLPSLAGYVRHLVRNAHDAEDIVQETLLRLHQRLAQFDVTTGRIQSLARAIALNLVRDQARQRKRRKTACVEELHDVLASQSPEACDQLIAVEKRKQVRRALRRLPAHQREAIRLRIFQDLDYQTMGKVLAVPSGTAGSRTSLGMRRLREILTERDAA